MHHSCTMFSSLSRTLISDMLGKHDTSCNFGFLCMFNVDTAALIFGLMFFLKLRFCAPQDCAYLIGLCSFNGGKVSTEQLSVSAVSPRSSFLFPLCLHGTAFRFRCVSTEQLSVFAVFPWSSFRFPLSLHGACSFLFPLFQQRSKIVCPGDLHSVFIELRVDSCHSYGTYNGLVLLTPRSWIITWCVMNNYMYTLWINPRSPLGIGFKHQFRQMLYRVFLSSDVLEYYTLISGPVKCYAYWHAYGRNIFPKLLVCQCVFIRSITEPHSCINRSLLDCRIM